jgi:hypothetical protein
MNLYLRECAEKNVKPNIRWQWYLHPKAMLLGAGYIVSSIILHFFASLCAIILFLISRKH